MSHSHRTSILAYLSQKIVFVVIKDGWFWRHWDLNADWTLSDSRFRMFCIVCKLDFIGDRCERDISVLSRHHDGVFKPVFSAPFSACLRHHCHCPADSCHGGNEVDVSVSCWALFFTHGSRLAPPDGGEVQHSGQHKHYCEEKLSTFQSLRHLH